MGDHSTFESAHTDLQALALEQVGLQLQNAGWTPPQPIAGAFNVDDGSESERRIQLALAYLRVEDGKLRAAVCDGSSVRSDVRTAANMTAVLAQSLWAAGGFIVPIPAIVNILVLFGLDKFCSLPPAAPAQQLPSSNNH